MGEGADGDGIVSGPAPPPERPSRWRLYFRLGRVSNLPTVWSNCLAGVILAEGSLTPEILVPLWFSLSLFYTGGMFLNDAFDHAADRLEKPGRPIPAGLIGLGEVFAAGFAQLGLGLLLLAVPGLVLDAMPRPEPLAGGLGLALLVVYYDYRHKKDPFGPLVMGLTRGAVYLIAAATAATAFFAPVWWGVAVMVAYLTGLTYAAKQENLRRVKNLWPLLLVAAPFIYSFPVAAGLGWGSLIYLFFLAWVAYALSFLLRRQGRNFPRAVISLIAGISLLDAMLIAATPGMEGWALIAAGGWVLTLLLQRFVTGT